MNRQPDRQQQAIIAVVALFLIAATLTGVLVLALVESSPASVANTPSTPTRFRIATLPIATVQPGASVTSSPSTLAAMGTPTATRIPAQRPHGQAEPSRTPSVSPSPTFDLRSTQSATDGACVNPLSQITSPQVGSILSGIVSFTGTASIEDFSFFKLEIRREGTARSDYVTFFTGYSPVDDGVLVRFDTRAWPNANYWIRLVVTDQTNNYPERCARLYTIKN